MRQRRSRTAPPCWLARRARSPLSPSGASRPCSSRLSRALLWCSCSAPSGLLSLFAPSGRSFLRLGPLGAPCGPCPGWAAPCCGFVPRLFAPASRVALFSFLVLQARPLPSAAATLLALFLFLRRALCGSSLSLGLRRPPFSRSVRSPSALVSALGVFW